MITLGKVQATHADGVSQPIASSFEARDALSM